MVHEKDDEYESQEEEEYHFSDDQANYEIEPETANAEAPATHAPSTAAQAGFARYKRPLIGVGVFVFLIFLVYKILTPNTTVPATDFSQNKVASKITSTVSAQHANPLPLPSRPAASSAMTSVLPTQQATPLVPVVSSAAALGNAPIQQSSAAMLTQVATQAPSSTSENVTTAQGAVEKLLSMQEENSRLISQLQSDSSQKAANNETQINAIQGKLQDLNMRISSMEATLAHLSQAIQEMRGGHRVPQASNPMGTANNDNQYGSSGPPAIRPEPHIGYTVQAIIPGRAWLKSDSGETVTVAEGDVLKNYGKIIKIDPYDGIVQIDSGGRLLTLSYGASND